MAPPAVPIASHLQAAIPAPDDGSTAAQLALLLQAEVLAHEHYRESATAFVNQLAASFGCARVTLGFMRHSMVDLAAVSHGDGLALVGPGFDAIAAAMDEAVQQGASIHLPVQPSARSAIRFAHGRLLQRQGGAVASVPLMHAGSVVGAVTCEWSAVPQALERKAERIETLVNLVGPVLNLMRLRETPLRERALLGLRQGWQRVRDIQDRRVQAAFAVAVLAAFVFLAVPMPYDVGGRAKLEGLLQRSLVAPTDGFLKAVDARPGDPVHKGQVLVELADQDLGLQRSKWVSELAQQESARDVALAHSDRAALVVAMARADQARAQLALVDADIQRSSIVAPFDGIVIQGDLSQAIGSPVERGKPLMLVAPGEAFRVMVDIDERDIAEVRVGATGALSLSALPWDAVPIRVTRVTPVARTVDGNNVFEVEAELRDPAAGHGRQLRPGLEGVAKLGVDRRPLAWAWTHRLTEWVRLKAWSWWT